MNIAQAKQIKLVDLMARLGYEIKAYERGHTEYKYLAPWRAEVAPSLNVNRVRNQFYDFGAGQGGNTLDFALLYLREFGHTARVTDALKWLEDTMGQGACNHTTAFSFETKSPDTKSQNTNLPRTLKFVKDSPLKSPLILDYLKTRKISPQIAKSYLLVVQYRNTSKSASERLYFGFGQQNISGGWEVRSAADGQGAFKSALITRDITLHPGTKPGRGAVSIFEGMLDHLSLLELLSTKRLRGDAIVMNALSSYKHTKAYIEKQGYKRIDLFLDNNVSGKKAAAKFKIDFGEIIFDQSDAYRPHVDLNDALRAGHRPEFDKDSE